MLNFLGSEFHRLVSLVASYILADDIFEIQSLLIALLLPVSIMAFEYSKNNNGDDNRLWRKNALLTQCIKPIHIGLEILGAIASAVLYDLCPEFFSPFATILFAMQLYRLAKICIWVYDETKPAIDRTFIKKCMDNYVKNLNLSSDSSLNTMKDMLQSDSEELNTQKLVKKCLADLESADCAQSDIFNIANMLASSISNKEINTFNSDTLEELTAFTIQNFNNPKTAASAHYILDTLIDAGLAGSLNYALPEKIWSAIIKNDMTRPDIYNLVQHISARCLQSSQGGPGRANSNQWNIVEYIIDTNTKKHSQHSTSKNIAAAAGALKAYMDWLLIQIQEYYSCTMRSETARGQTISDNINQTTTSLFGLTVNQAIIGDIATLNATINKYSTRQRQIQKQVKDWGQLNRRFLIDDSVEYMDLTIAEAIDNDADPMLDLCKTDAEGIKQKYCGSIKLLLTSGAILPGQVKEYLNASKKALSGAPKPSSLAANLNRLVDELVMIDEQIHKQYGG